MMSMKNMIQTMGHCWTSLEISLRVDNKEAQRSEKLIT